MEKIILKKFKNFDFIERASTINFFKKLFLQIPNQITFFYGPKSCGKTTLLNYVREKILSDKNFKNKITFFWYDMREETFTSYKDLLNLLFPVAKDSNSNLKLFNISLSEREKLNLKQIEPYQIINQRIEQEIKKKRKVVIIFDEIQLLKGIWTEEKKEFLYELINYFIKQTKVEHKVNVIFVTSDAYFLTELFQKGKLEASAQFVFLDFLNENEINYWLSKYKFKNQEIDYLKQKINGNPWLISQVIQYKKLKENWKAFVENYIETTKTKIITAINKIENEDLKKRVILFLKELTVKNGELKISIRSFEKDVLEFLIENEIIFFDPQNGKIKIQLRSMLETLKKIFNEYKASEELFID